MKKKKKLLALIAVFIIMAAMFLFLKQMSDNKKLVQIPKIKTVSKIEFTESNNYKYTKYQDKNSIDEIYNVLHQAKLCKTKKSISETPLNIVGGLTTIIITTKDNEETYLNAYKSDDGKYYIEKPYVSIHEISKQDYNALIKRTK